MATRYPVVISLDKRVTNKDVFWDPAVKLKADGSRKSNLRNDDSIELGRHTGINIRVLFNS
ncbi:hypothetical protein A6R68_20408 [Neotoma lepida]|uniref:Uncharacterized protein n=1 Tax=Neotoma lepida TaxID=56216 RepID=A0A1A6HTQ9_NEOLE|nr:hypothetical protein A6R68_20408 [Neotoma lepida]